MYPNVISLAPWRIVYPYVADRKQGSKFSERERFGFGGHDSTIAYFGIAACSILVRSTEKTTSVFVGHPAWQRLVFA
jgi:hypothetical protein